MKVVLRAALGRYTIETAAQPERTRRRAITISPRSGARTVLRRRQPAPAGSGNGAAAGAEPAAAV